MFNEVQYFGEKVGLTGVLCFYISQTLKLHKTHFLSVAPLINFSNVFSSLGFSQNT